MKRVVNKFNIENAYLLIDGNFFLNYNSYKELLSIALEGIEYGVTTGRGRTVNWLNLDKLIDAINISGTAD